MYLNPIEIRDRSGTVIPFYLADPYVIRHAGCYYCYNTAHDGVTLLMSPDLFHFTYIGYALQCEDEQDFWAPCVVYCNGTFYMYYSSRPSEEADVHMQRLKVATSSSPRGPFTYKATLCDSFSIDADVQVSAEGVWTIFYATNDFRGNDPRYSGTCIVEDKLVSPFVLSGKAREVVIPSSRKELFCANRFGDGRDWYTIEAPCSYEHLGELFLLYSGNAYTSENYFVDFAQKKEQTWKKRCGTGKPLLSTSDTIMGTGHNSIIKAPNLMDDWLVYHGMRKLPTPETPETRELCCSRLIPSTSHLRLLEEPSAFLYRPWQPEICCFTELSDENDSSLWESVDGMWNMEPNRLTQSDADANAYLLLKRWVKGFVCEVSIQSPATFRGNVAGITAAYIDDHNHTNVLLNTGRRELQLLHVQAGICHWETYALPGIDFSAMHTLRVERTGQWICAAVDGQVVMQTTVSWEQARVGLVAMHTAATFSGFAFNESYRINTLNFRQTMCLLEVEHGKMDGITFNTSEGKILCGTDRTSFIEDLGSEWQATVEVNCNTPFINQPQLILGFLDKDRRTILCNTVFDFEHGHALANLGTTTKEFLFVPRESNAFVFIQKNGQLYVNGEGCSCLLPSKCNSRIFLAARGEFELRQIVIERIR